jgi:hypothetical protein
MVHDAVSSRSIGWFWLKPYFGWIGEFAGPMSLRRAAYLAFGTLWTVGTFAFGGGLLARRSLMEMGIRTSVGWIPSLKIVSARWFSMIWSTCMPLIAAAGLALIPVGLGFVARWGTVGEYVAFALLIPCVILVIAIGWLVSISLLGFTLNVCAILAEKMADAFDGLSRSAAYVFQRPLTIALLCGAATGLAFIGLHVVEFVLQIGWTAVESAFSIGFGKSFKRAFTSIDGFAEPRIAGALPAFVHLLQAGFLFSFLWSASSAAYLILRYEIDHTEFDELDLQEIGEPEAMPAVKTDADGVAEVVKPSDEPEKETSG